MKTKIVYVVASLDADIYMEQALVSAWSARHYNPDSRIEMVCGQDTFATLSSGIRAQYKSLFDQIHVREFQPEQSMMERSRWMKTSLREIIEGDYLFLDTDTVVCSNLSFVDDYGFDIGMVLDQNCEMKDFLYATGVTARAKKYFDIDLSTETQYFNSGVAYVKDSKPSHLFYEKWHELWKSKIHETEGVKDQSSLAATNVLLGHQITEMSGDMNCQIMVSIQYLHTAHIMHFYNTLFIANGPSLSPFYGKSLFLEVKEKGITEDIAYKILHCKSLFASPSMPVPYEGAMLWRKHLSKPTPAEVFEARLKTTNSYHLIYSLWCRVPKFMHIMDKLIGSSIRVLRAIKNIFSHHPSKDNKNL